MGRRTENTEWISKYCGDSSEIFERYLSEKIFFTNRIHDTNLCNKIYTLRDERLCINKEIRDVVCKAFINQLVKSGDVKPETYLTYLNLVIMKDILNRYKGKPIPRYSKDSSDNKRYLKAFINAIKVTIIRRGPNRTLEGIPVESTLITLSPTISRYNIRLDLTTTNLYKLCLKIYTEKYSLNSFPFKSSQSLGQVIRYHKDSFIRQGFKIYTYKKGSKHIVLDYALDAEETEYLVRNEIKKGWY